MLTLLAYGGKGYWLGKEGPLIIVQVTGLEGIVYLTVIFLGISDCGCKELVLIKIHARLMGLEFRLLQLLRMR